MNILKPTTLYLTTVALEVIQQPFDNVSIVGTDDKNLARTIKESIYIRVNSLFMKKKIGKNYLSHILG